MKILWFTPIPPKAALERKGRTANSTGFWIHSLIDLLASRDDVTLGIAYEDHGSTEPFRHVGVDYFPIKALGKIKAVCCIDFGHRQKVLGSACEIIQKYRPDVIHVHGFESVYGLIKAEKITTRPVIVSIQGMMGPWGRVAWGNKSFWDVARTQRRWDLMRGFPSLRSKAAFERKTLDEVRTIKTVNALLGRTDFDRSYAWSIAPQVSYYSVGEIMRDGFYEERWSWDASEPFTLFTSGRLNFQKGIHMAIEATAVLKQVFPLIRLKIGGGLVPFGECLYLQRYVKKLGLCEQVEFLGWLPEKELIRQLKSARVYLNPSFIENSSNALAEAMLLGVPCVASMVGGTGSQITHRVNGLLYPADQAAMLADSVRLLLANREFAVKLGNAARDCALQKHDRTKTVSDLLGAYRAVCSFET